MTPNLLDELEAYNRLCSTPGIDVSFKYQAAANFMNTHAPALADMAKRMEAAERDSKRLDWLADRNNSIGQVLLPTESVEANLHDMRAAIDHAMNAAAQEGAG